jgi:hypothetical protein
MVKTFYVKEFLEHCAKGSDGRPRSEPAVGSEALVRAWSCRNPDDSLAWCLQITRNEAFRLISRQQPRASV